MTNVYRLTSPREEDHERFVGQAVDRIHFNVLLTKSVKVLRPDGTTLCLLLKEAISLNAGGLMYRAIRDKQSPLFLTNGECLIGYLEADEEHPQCRQTGFVKVYRKAFDDCRPAAQEVSVLFAKNATEIYRHQRALADQTSADFLIPGTVFTTLTLDRKTEQFYKKESGQSLRKFCVMSCFRGGSVDGGQLVFPAYRIALRLDSRDVVFFDAEEVHGISKIKFNRDKSDFSTILYAFRENMQLCGSADEEFARTQND